MTRVRGTSSLLVLFALVSVPTARAQWVALSSPTADTLRAVQFVDENVGWVAGYNGVVRKTIDGGLNWTPQNSGTSVRLIALRFVDANNGFVNGGLYVARTVDGGANWTPLTIDPSALIFRNLGFATAANVYWVPAACGNCVPATRWFYRYTVEANGSTTEQTFDVIASTAPFLDMHFVDADNGWAVGFSGLIRRITNASGATPGFAFQPSGTTQTLNGVFMLNASEGWAVGNSGTIRRWNGSSWTTQSSPTVANLRDVHFRDPANGWIVGDGGVILRFDGVNWVPEDSAVGVPLFGINAQAVSVYAVGGDLATSTNGVALKRDILFADGFED